MKISAADIKGVLGFVPTPAVADAASWACEQSVDLDETARMISLLCASGIKIFVTNGTYGEGSTLTFAEQKAFNACVAQSLHGRGLLFAGVTTLNTRDTIARGRALLELGADGLFLGRPMWLALDQKAIVRYYADIAEALPGAPLIIYDNPIAFKGKISTDAYVALSRNPAIVATKHIGGPSMAQDLRATEGRMRILPIETQWASLAREFPDEAIACWSGAAGDGPEPLMALADAIGRADWPRAERISERMNWAQMPMFPGGSLERFMDYSIPIGRARLEGSKLINAGPSRPPYRTAPEDYLEGGRETGRRWRALRSEFPFPSETRRDVAAE